MQHEVLHIRYHNLMVTEPGMKILKTAIQSRFSWGINYWALWKMFASVSAIALACLGFLIYQDPKVFVLFAFIGYI